jgi:hypothetical protein
MHNLREEQIKMREEFNRLEHRFEVILGRMGVSLYVGIRRYASAYLSYA